MRQLTISKSITNRDSQSLEKYLQEIGKVDLISAEEEVVLARKIREGDVEALEKLTSANLRFVVSVAKQYQNHHLSLNDLINEGNLGLVKAATKFDETRGFKFISYAVWWIRQSIIQALAEHSRLVRLPLNRLTSIAKLKKAFSELEQEFEREPSNEELASVLDLTADEVERTIKMSTGHVSVNAPFNKEGEDGSLLDVLVNKDAEIADQNMTYSNSLSIETERTLSILSPRESEIVKMFFGINMTHAMKLEDIAEKFDITRERVRQIKDQAILKLRNNPKSKLLKGYLGN
ncbi:MAG TPA: sigma-70 family RNA polymerase sigma factor [Bacteroidetes bacterium]|nr:sigma-70 family RNA polymerase sigma factor [Bacteroidota bacterium]